MSSLFYPIHAVAKEPTPVLNTPSFRDSFGGPSGKTLSLDSWNLLRAVETVALKGEKFRVLEELPDEIVRASIAQCPGQEVYVDRRFLEFSPQKEEEKKELPSISQVLDTMQSVLDVRYIWGGTWPFGIPSLLDYYPPSIDLSRVDPLIADTWQLKGVDCSGLLYYATNGMTPRNTAELVYYGKPIDIEGKTPQEIVERLKPLDLIVWKGHVVIVFDSIHSIESLLGHGVIKQSLLKRIEEIMNEKKRIPVNAYDAMPELGDRFVICRWHPDHF